MDRMRKDYSIKELCGAFEVSASGYFGHLSGVCGTRERDNQELVVAIHKIHDDKHTRHYGSPRMTEELRAAGYRCSENRVARLMRRAKVAARPSRAFRPRTTVVDPDKRPSPNRLKSEPNPTVPGQALVSDITYVATKEGWLYLAVTMDLFSRKIVGWSVDKTMKWTLVERALRNAQKRGGVSPGGLYHSDRGSQYTSLGLREKLKNLGLRQSMSGKGHCYDNATCESFFATLKREGFPEDGVFENRQEASRELFEYIEIFYNRKRRHTSLGNRSPEQFLQKYFQETRPELN